MNMSLFFRFKFVSKNVTVDISLFRWFCVQADNFSEITSIFCSESYFVIRDSLSAISCITCFAIGLK